jgi:transposase, IS5 family
VTSLRVKRRNRSVLHEAKKQLDKMIPQVQQALRQTREWVLRGNTKTEGKVLSIVETHTEVIRQGKANSPMSSANWS